MGGAPSCFPRGIPAPGKNIFTATLASHPGKMLQMRGELYADYPPYVDLAIDEADDENPFRLVLQDKVIRVAHCDPLCLARHLYYDDADNERHSVDVVYYSEGS